MASPFDSVEPWEPNLNSMLQVGNHVVTIESAEGIEASTGTPGIHLKLVNANGSIQDWLYYGRDNLRSLAGLYTAATDKLPQEGEFDPDPETNYKLTDACIARLNGKRVGIRIDEEEDNRPEAKYATRLRVRGYVAASRIQDDMPADTTGMSSGAVSQGQLDDIPF